MKILQHEHKREHRYFRKKITEWYKFNKRNFYWRTKTDPYTILISEIFLKKTSAVYAEKYIIEFLERYKTVKDLYETDDKMLINFFKPLGLVSRGRGLKRISEKIIKDYNCEIPKDKKLLKNLFMVGDYVVNCILCFSFNEKVPIVDTNVIRIFKRFFNFNSINPRPCNDKEIWYFAKELLPYKNVKQYNWALLDFGALVCSSRKPKCTSCPISRKCFFLNQSTNI